MATRKLDQSKLMIQAGRSGEDVIQRAHEARSSNIQQTANRAQSQRQFETQVEQQGFDRAQREWESKRRDKLEREKHGLEVEGQKAWTPSGKFFDQTQELREQDFRESAVGQQLEQQQQAGGRQQQAVDIERDKVDLEAAQSGLMRAPDDPRLQAMQAEMARGSEQMGQGLETSAQGQKFIPSPAGEQAQQAQQELAVYEAETDRIKELAGWKKVGRDFNTADIREQNATSATERKEQQEVKEIKRKELLLPLRQASERMDRLFKGGGAMRDKDWEEVRKQAGLYLNPNLPEALKEISDAIEAKVWTPRVQAFMQQRENVRVMEYIAEIGELPSGNYVDMSSPAMVEYTQKAMALRKISEMPANQQLETFRSPAETIRYYNKRAAVAVLVDLPVLTAPERIALGPAERHQGMQAAGGGGQEPQEPTHEQRRARSAGKEGEEFGPAVSAITPEAAERRAQQPPPALSDTGFQDRRTGYQHAVAKTGYR